MSETVRPHLQTAALQAAAIAAQREQQQIYKDLEEAARIGTTASPAGAPAVTAVLAALGGSAAASPAAASAIVVLAAIGGYSLYSTTVGRLYSYQAVSAANTP